MTETARPPSLAGGRLWAPALQPQPLAIRAVEPSPCSTACPAGINVKSYVSLIAEGRFAEALEVVRERCPLPGICGRICHHPCEAACRRAEIDQPVAVRALKRFVADLELELPEPPVPPAPDKTDRVAIVGSGPAGLTAAYDLRLAGYPVTVFEAEPEPGGMLRYGIADYRLPPEVLDAEIAVLVRAGIEIETGCRIGPDRALEDLLAGGYSAVLFAVGAQRGRRLPVEGAEDCPQVEDALAFLRRVNRGERTPVDGRVLVVGGGSTAIEAARAALRLGAETVEIVYRRHRGEMPADEEEIEVAEAEGIGLRLLTAPSRVVTRRGRLAGLECLEVALGEPDASGRRRPIPIPGSEHLLEADRVFAAVGQEAVLDFIPDPVADRLTERGRVVVDRSTAMTALRGVFAAGDVVTGPATVIDAIAAGHDAAGAIRDFLEQGLPERREPRVEPHASVELEIPAPPPPEAPRHRPPLQEIAPGREFAEVERAFSPADAVAEAGRCLRCGPCGECRICAPSCGRRHLALWLEGEEPTLLRVPARLAVGLDGGARAGAPTGWLIPADNGPFEPPRCLPVELAPHRIAIDERFCRGCSRCLEVCAFDALALVDPEASESTVRLEPALCRGCNLCAAACPTDAVVPSWAAAPRTLGPQPPVVVFTCQRRADATAASLAALGLSADGLRLVPVRCAGEIDAGRLLEVYRHGASAVLVAGCASGSCRYDRGPELAAEQVRRARGVLSALGLDPGCFVGDWAPAETAAPIDPRWLDPASEPGAPADGTARAEGGA